MLRSIWKEKKQNSQEAVARHRVRDNRGLKNRQWRRTGETRFKSHFWGRRGFGDQLAEGIQWWVPEESAPRVVGQFKGCLNPGKRRTEATTAGALLSPVSFFPTIFNQQHSLQLIKSQTAVESPLLFKLPRASQSSPSFLLFPKDHLNSQLFKYSTCNFRYHLSPCWKCKFLGATHTLTKSESLCLEVSNLRFNLQVILNTC